MSENDIKRSEYRYRHRYLPAYYRSTVPDKTYAFFDKIQLELAAFDLTFKDTAAYRRFRNDFSLKQITSRASTTFGPPILDRWLFSGRIKFEPKGHSVRVDPTDLHHGIHIRISYELHLNPTRFIHHCFRRYGARAVDLAYLRTKAPGDLLLRTEIAFEEQSLDLDDNIIPPQIFRKLDFDGLTRFYVELIIDYLNDELSTSLTDTDPNSEVFKIELQNDWNISGCEVYFEYATEDALSFVNGLWPEFRKMFFAVDEKEFRVDQKHRRAKGWQTPPHRGIRNNSMVVYANLGRDDLLLVTYAKDYDRVRFEFRYSGTLRRFFGPSGTHERVINRLPGAFEALEMAKNDAHKRFVKIHRALPDLGYTERADYIIFADFLDRLARLHKRHRSDIQLAHIISCLAANDGYVVELGSREHKMMEALEKEYIVSRVKVVLLSPKGRRKYALNTRYSGVFEAFRTIFSDRQTDRDD